MNKIKAIVLFLIIGHSPQAFGQPTNALLIGAASDLKFALDSIKIAFNKTHSGTLEITYGSSGKLMEQILHGAPFDIFFSADIRYPNQLKAKGFASSEVYPYGIGRIVLWSKKIDPTLKEMNALLLPSLRKIAIANPAHAPYGKRAEEALMHYKLMEAIKSKLVLGENISQTAQFVTTGAADIGIIALSLALSPAMKKENGKYFLIPESSHQPLVQGFVITSHARGNELAHAFQQFVERKQATDILRYFGFSKPK